MWYNGGMVKLECRMKKPARPPGNGIFPTSRSGRVTKVPAARNSCRTGDQVASAYAKASVVTWLWRDESARQGATNSTFPCAMGGRNYETKPPRENCKVLPMNLLNGKLGSVRYENKATKPSKGGADWYMRAVLWDLYD